MRLGYLYSRYPVLSQTFCDAEMLELERRGFELVVASMYPPKTEVRHEYLARLQAPDSLRAGKIGIWKNLSETRNATDAGRRS